MTQHLIAGGWRGSSDAATRQVIDPYDRSVVAEVAEGGEADAEAAISAARTAFDRGEWPATPARERGRLLSSIADLLERDRDEITHLETRDTGKTLTEAGYDVDDVISVFRYYSGLADKHAGEVINSPNPGSTSVVVHEPIGVCAQISPWNYPLLQASWKFAPALAAGNTVVVKPSELTPLTTIRMVALAVEAGVPDGVVNLVLGPGPTVGHALAASDAVDLVSFTGGLETGRRVMAAASGNVKRVALELGGKNPNIVFSDVDLDTAVDHALTAVFLHAGQVCSAGSRLLVEETVHDAFVDAVCERAARIRLGSGLDPETESGPLISAAHREKVERYVSLGQEEGAKVAVGGRRPSDPDLQRGFFYEPTVLVGCENDMRVVQEEIFGPVLTVERFHTEEEAVARANSTIYGLAGAVWTGDGDRAQRVAQQLRLGTVWINDYHPYFPEAEWGGFKQSGIGRELGRRGLEEYTETKHIYRNLAPQPAGWFKP